LCVEHAQVGIGVGGLPRAKEERAAAEVTRPLGVIAAPEAALAFNPAFDVTPARLIRGIVTEHGVIEPVTPERIRDILGR
jgi:methylthioribose-1-phosphate isomerase